MQLKITATWEWEAEPSDALSARLHLAELMKNDPIEFITRLPRQSRWPTEVKVKLECYDCGEDIELGESHDCEAWRQRTGG